MILEFRQELSDGIKLRAIGDKAVRIHRMAFILRDPQNGVTQQLFLLKSRHDLELECRIVDRDGKVIPEPIRLAFTLDDKRVNQLDRRRLNHPAHDETWRNVILSILDEGVLNATGEWVAAKAILKGIAMIAEFGEALPPIEEDITPSSYENLTIFPEKVR